MIQSLRRTRAVLLAALLALGSVAHASATPPLAMPANPYAARNDWWKHAVVYEIYPRSFADSNNDGIGDIPGITQHLPYLRALGIDAIWIAPMMKSSQVDFGYDVEDYRSVDPEYGTVADVDRLIADGRPRGVKVILDFVINHTSNKHPWFEASAKNRTGPYADWYVWHNPAPGGGVPNNWTSAFGGSAWTWDPARKQYYYHFFYKEQPDLNYRNPAVESAMFANNAWWLQRGVYGWRLDAIDTLFERSDLKDNPLTGGLDPYGQPAQSYANTTGQPEQHGFLQRLRARVIDRYPGRVLIGETYPPDVAALVAYYGPKNDEVQMPMYLSLISKDPIRTPDLRRRVEAVETNSVGGWPTFALSNHDNPRVPSRIPRPQGTTGDDMAKITAAFLLTVRGTPILYYGEELGMVNTDPTRREDVKDIIGRTGWPKEKGRDGERTPMQWSAAPNAGFNRGAKPWLPVAADYRTRNVETEIADPNSVLGFYRALIAERRANPALSGDFHVVDRDDPQVFGFQRTGGGKTVLTLLNFGDHAADVSLGAAQAHAIGRVIASNRAATAGNTVRLEPLGAFVAQVER